MLCLYKLFKPVAQRVSGHFQQQVSQVAARVELVGRGVDLGWSLFTVLLPEKAEFQITNIAEGLRV